MKNKSKLVNNLLTILTVILLVILSIVWYSSYSKNVRNVTRLKDVNNVIKSLELFSSSFWFFPVSSNWFQVTYLSWTIWDQWTVWESMINYLSNNLRENMVDPLTWEQYSYSLLNNKKEYQIKAIYEDGISLLPVNKNSKLDEKYLIKWNYNWKLASLKIDNTIRVLALPSIMINGKSDISLLSIIKNKKYLYNYNLWIDWFVPKKLELYSWSVDWLKDFRNKTVFLNNYKEAYTDFKKKNKIQKSLDKFDINIKNYDSDLDYIANELLLNSVKEINNPDFFKTKESRFVIDNFILNKEYEEISEEKRIFSDRWWVNSWAFFNIRGWKWSTNQWKLEKWSKWQTSYSKYNSWYDTDWWYYPQNIFRLILNTKFKNLEQYTYFKINKYILSKSKNRYESNWFLLFSRYIDADNLYYAWFRVDWDLVIKKKYKRQYYTLKSKKVFDWIYDREKKPNLIPINKLIWIKLEMKNIEENKVRIKAYTDIHNSWVWTLVLDFEDSNESSDEQVLNNEWYAWVRSDFMDVEIDKYYIKEL
jgi:hypothetical protein